MSVFVSSFANESFLRLDQPPSDVSHRLSSEVEDARPRGLVHEVVLVVAHVNENFEGVALQRFDEHAEGGTFRKMDAEFTDKLLDSHLRFRSERDAFGVHAACHSPHLSLVWVTSHP